MPLYSGPWMISTHSNGIYSGYSRYKASEIQELTAPIVKYHLHKTIKQRASVSLLKALFLVERPKIYLIKGKNPMGFKKHGPLRIPKTEENLLKYFLL